MHELSIALSLLDLASEEAARQVADGHEDVRVTAIHVKVGQLSGVVPEALSSAFELARESSSSPQARLIIEHVPVTVGCRTCGGPSPVVSIQNLSCATCGRPSAEIVGGRELELVALEVEECLHEPS